MKKSTLFLSLAIMLGLSVSLFAEFPQEQSSDCMIPPPPQFQQERDFNDDIMSFWDIDMDRNDGRPCEGKMKHHKKHFKKGKFNKKHFDKKFKDLNLTDKQKEDLKALKKESIESKKELEKEFRTKVKALNDEFLKEKYSSKEIKKLTKDIKNLSAKLIDNRVAKKEGMKKILTAEQYNKMFKIKSPKDMFAERLGLSEEQKEKVTKIFEAKKEKETVLRKELFEKNIALKKEFDKENVDKDTISKLSEDISNISKELLKLDIDTKMELKSILTAEQYNKFIKPVPNSRKNIIYEPNATDKNIDKK